MSEFRKDPVSGEWIIVAPERMKRPDEFLSARKPKRVPEPKKSCPFEDLKKSGNWPPILLLPNSENWRVAVIPNKYPALTHGGMCADIFKDGPYEIAQGVGHHELVVSRDHLKPLYKLSLDKGAEVVSVIQARCAALSRDKCVAYVAPFFNWGPSAGGSLYHPHYQILALPIVPPEVEHSLRSSGNYLRKHKKCVHCDVVRYELRFKKRIIAENKHAVALAPFVSINRFEVRIFPKKHAPNFDQAGMQEIRGVAALLQSVLGRIEKQWNDPDLNFHIHSAPAKNRQRYASYHWHIEVVPKNIIPPQGGFELGTRVDINSADPDKVAAMLRGEKI